MKADNDTETLAYRQTVSDLAILNYLERQMLRYHE